ncbi:MAG: flagellar protein FliS [Methylococcales bacterium]|jgi:flagellar protein FliS|nr:flagellar protein FliS [Methylococcales bacterium]
MSKELRDYTRNEDFNNEMQVNPNTLTTLLLNAAIEKVSDAKQCHEEKRFAKKGFLIGRATAIVDGLRDRLDMSQGEIAGEFEQFYSDIDNALQESIEDDGVQALTDIVNALTEIRNLWQDVVTEIEVAQGTYDYIVAETEMDKAA